MTRKVKTISFSLISEYDSRLLEYAEKAERGSFSKYIKRLIDDDMRGGQRVVSGSIVEVNQLSAPFADPVDDEADAMSGFL
ncbi:hypothetical protein [Sporosarcina sp. P17b]|uniref:hypothetical protein n=1 Tax=Sporosarcina sp. P17b TaxID=2048260 RepID=UPI000C1688D2|nr:hypothetical protein [Sporosarcina sp. P17b]PIC71021.1 hypothetical protein CSV76_16770 [Sporosarcina sp. P17b]